MARSRCRCISDLCFSWLAVGLLVCCVDLLAIPTVAEIDSVYMCALQKQFCLCILDGVVAVKHGKATHLGLN